VKIAREAREAAKHDVLIAGSIGPLGVVPARARRRRIFAAEIFREQAEALEERGVDFFILETFGDPAELVAAIDAIRSFSQLPIVAEMTYSEEGTTFSGTRPRDAWAMLHERGVQVIGANCSVGPQDHLRILQELAAVAGSFPMSAMPNVGFPQRAGDRVIYPKSSPEYFDLFAREAVAWAREFWADAAEPRRNIFARWSARWRATSGRGRARGDAVIEAAPRRVPPRRGNRKARCGEKFRRSNS
jgi:methionine synthase I (cobalamin-dependent)